MCNGKPLSVDKNCAADEIKYLHWFAGKPGTGKSRSVLPHVRELSRMLSVGYHAPGSISELQGSKADIGDVFVLDDIFDISCETHQLLLVQWYNSLPAMCKIVVLSNYGIV